MLVTTVKTEHGTALIKHWTEGVFLDEGTMRQARNLASLPFIYKHVALMPDCHLGKGATIGSVIPTRHAIIPAAVGVDLGCGMIAVETDLTANDLPDSLHDLRIAIEEEIPVGNGRGGDYTEVPNESLKAWRLLNDEFEQIQHRHKKLKITRNPAAQIGTLGGGNHFIEVCLDEKGNVWLMLHSGSRGIGNHIGNYFIALAREEMRRFHINLPDRDLAYLKEGTLYFDDYWFAVKWAQRYAYANREVMMSHLIRAVQTTLRRPLRLVGQAINCHHNYVDLEYHYGERVYLTRKGAIRARSGDPGIIPGSMGAKSYIVKGKGNPESFCSCSHGAGRVMSRSEARRRFTAEEHIRATKGVECRKDTGVIDETPKAYKDIDRVMAAQSDLVEIVHTLKQIVCVKG